MHATDAPVRILEYYVSYGQGVGLPPRSGSTESSSDCGGVGTRLTGLVHFSARAESHRGYCHGGSMCSVIDDAVGWCSFLVTGACRPWSGFTVQVNTNLCKPIPVNSTLLVQATVTKLERRKVSVQAVIFDPIEEASRNSDAVSESTQLPSQPGIIHATGEGLVILNRGIIPELLLSESISVHPSNLPLT
jgi:acyl-coenzyme A thioesterase PaaI-like protein